MSLLDDVIINSTAVISAVGKKTSEVVEKSKKRISTAELKEEIAEQFESLGRYVYDTHKSGLTDNEVVTNYIDEISELIVQLKELQESLDNSKKKILCPACFTENTADSVYCKHCGSSLDTEDGGTQAAGTADDTSKPEENDS